MQKHLQRQCGFPGGAAHRNFPAIPEREPLAYRRHLRGGSVFIIALWTLLLLSSFALSLGVIVRQKLTLISRINSREALHYIASAGIMMGIAELRKDDYIPEYDALKDAWSDNPEIFNKIPIGGGEYTVGDSYSNRAVDRYGLVDEESKININRADADTLTRLFQNVANLDDKAVDLAYQIQDWSDADSFFQHPRYGAEDSDYKDLDDRYEAKDSPFTVLEEVLLVKGMTQDVFDRVKGFITVYGNGGVNINTAPPEVLLALGLDGRLLDLVLQFRRGDDLIEGTADDRVFDAPQGIAAKLSQHHPLSPSEVAKLNNLVAKDKFVTKSEYFMIHSVGCLPSDEKVEISAVVDRGGQIQYWREKY